MILKPIHFCFSVLHQEKKKGVEEEERFNHERGSMLLDWACKSIKNAV